MHQVTGTGANGSFKLKESMPSPTKSHNLSNKKVTQGQLIFKQTLKDSSTSKETSAKEDINLFHQETLLKYFHQSLLNPSTTPEMTMNFLCFVHTAIGSETNKHIEIYHSCVGSIVMNHMDRVLSL